MPQAGTITARRRFLPLALVASLCCWTAANAVEPPARVEGAKVEGNKADGNKVDGANADAAKQLTIATERVVIFKDGYALFIKTASGTTDADGRLFTDQVPDGAVLGCFWATTDQQKTVGMSAEWVEKTTEKTTTTACVTTVELLRANRGHKVVLVLAGDKTSSVSGNIVDVLDLPALPPQPAPAGAIGRHPEWISSARLQEAAENPFAEPFELVPRGGQLVAIDIDQGRLVLPVVQVMTVAGTDLVTTMVRRTQQTVRSKRLGFDLGKDAANRKATLRILYFSEGLRWIPTYRISGNFEDKADISLQGELINETEDISDAAVDLVVGVPNFRFKTTVSPLTLESTLRQALASADPSLRNNAYSQVMMNQNSAGAVSDVRDTGAAALSMAPELSAGGQQDLFVYGAKHLALKKGARATLPLWQSTAAMRHFYTFDIPVVRDPQSGASYRSGDDDDNGNRNRAARSPLRLAEHQVWHKFELNNTSPVPWTTGAALIIRDTLPIGQDLLAYTPVGATSLLPVTVAIDMCGDYAEQELARQQGALVWDRTTYALIRKRVTITVRNLRKQPSLTRVSVGLGGKAEVISDDGRIQLNDYRSEDWKDHGNREVNNHSDLSWELTLDAGATKTLTCEFGFYLR